jgi:hypothetical protein
MSTTHNRPVETEAIEVRMSCVRQQISHDLRVAQREIRQWVDWRRWVASYPLPTLGAAALIGFWLVPRRPSRRGDLATLPPGISNSVDGFQGVPWRRRWLTEGSVLLLRILAQNAIRSAQAARIPRPPDRPTVSTENQEEPHASDH